jgi:hypothetical protein
VHQACGEPLVVLSLLFDLPDELPVAIVQVCCCAVHVRTCRPQACQRLLLRFDVLYQPFIVGACLLGTILELAHSVGESRGQYALSRQFRLHSLHFELGLRRRRLGCFHELLFVKVV